MADAGESHRTGAVDGAGGRVCRRDARDRVLLTVQYQQRTAQRAQRGAVPLGADLAAPGLGVPGTAVDLGLDPGPGGRLGEGVAGGGDAPPDRRARLDVALPSLGESRARAPARSRRTSSSTASSAVS
ncbi:hypothetical protein GCM10010145_66590 [Streptomyces ruber]|uniref:Uncharacterized protein n=2 Tax=Streptomyces TaxID=1883 RepID=A0A918BR46_9ACTN|nr:hypothetical protein GCM10010145_66590 [Streptomyces ruber]